jgi:hypothetical protein
LIELHSTASDRCLVIGKMQGPLFPVELSGSPVTARTQLWVEYDAPELAGFLQQLGAQREPWSGEKVWNSLEGDLSLVVTCSITGVVTILVSLSGSPGSSEAWTVTAGIDLGFGELERIARHSEGLRVTT